MPRGWSAPVARGLASASRAGLVGWNAGQRSTARRTQVTSWSGRRARRSRDPRAPPSTGTGGGRQDNDWRSRPPGGRRPIGTQRCSYSWPRSPATGACYPTEIARSGRAVRRRRRGCARHPRGSVRRGLRVLLVLDNLEHLISADGGASSDCSTVCLGSHRSGHVPGGPCAFPGRARVRRGARSRSQPDANRGRRLERSTRAPTRSASSCRPRSGSILDGLTTGNVGAIADIASGSTASRWPSSLPPPATRPGARRARRSARTTPGCSGSGETGLLTSGLCGRRSSGRTSCCPPSTNGPSCAARTSRADWRSWFTGVTASDVVSVVGSLEPLVDVHLVRTVAGRADVRRFDLLDTIRAFVVELDALDDQGIRDAHGRWATAVATAAAADSRDPRRRSRSTA